MSVAAAKKKMTAAITCLLVFALSSCGDPLLDKPFWGGAFGNDDIYGSHRVLEACSAPMDAVRTSSEPGDAALAFSIVELTPKIACLGSGETPCADSGLEIFTVALLEEEAMGPWLSEHEGADVGLNVGSFAARSDEQSEDALFLFNAIDSNCTNSATVNLSAMNLFKAMLIDDGTEICETIRTSDGESSQECWSSSVLEDRPDTHFPTG